MKIINLNRYLICALLSFSLLSCEKNDEELTYQKKNMLTDVVRDNFGLTFLATSLARSGMDATLSSSGPYTLLAPSDEAYKKTGYQNPAAVFADAVDKLAEENKYHILKTELSFADKPLQMNQELETLLGTKVYWSRVLKGLDTITTINGGRILQADTKADNGTMQVLDRVLVPNVQATLKDGLAADISLTLFYEALKFSGMLENLNGAANFTIFAPNNAAMKKFGYANLEAIEQADPEVLKAWLNYHIARERRFAQDYFLLSPVDIYLYEETMLDGRKVSINLLRQSNVPNSFTGITIRGTGNPSPIAPVKSDIVTGNGVIHTIGEVLK